MKKTKKNKSKLLYRLFKATRKDNIESNFISKIIFFSKRNIKTGKDSNGKRFKKRKTERKNKILYDSGDLYKSIKKTSKNNLRMNLYGLYNYYGTRRGIDSRKFIPMNGSKQLTQIAKIILKGLKK